MDKTIGKRLIRNSQIALAVSTVLLIISSVCHFNLTDGVSFSPDLYVDYQSKNYNIFEHERAISNYSCHLKDDRDASFRMASYSFKLTPKERDYWLNNTLNKDEKRTNVNGFPGYRKEGDEGGGEYTVFTNNLHYSIRFDNNIGESKEQELLHAISISGGDMSTRYFLGEGFYLFFALFVLSLTLFFGYTKKYEQTN